MKRVYISGPLHAVDDRDELRKFYEFVADICRDCGFYPYMPHTNTDPVEHQHLTSADVFSRDLEALRVADVIIAYIGRPSSGVGAELGIAFNNDKIIIAILREGEAPSRFLLGMLEACHRATTIRYRDLEHCSQILRKELHGLFFASNEVDLVQSEIRLVN
jgi:nucleoside 2-deoxyribosyltransferase